MTRSWWVGGALLPGGCATVARMPACPPACPLAARTPRDWRPAPGIAGLCRWPVPLRGVVFEVAFDAAGGRVLEGDDPSDPGCPDEHL